MWLTHILSQADHRLSHVQPWAQKRLHTLQSCIPQPIRPLDFSDDRLAAVLRALSADERWRAFEGDLNRQLLRVYDLHPKTVRVDTTTAKGYRAVTPEGLFQFGHSKDHRPDLPQVKVLLATLDPLGLPVAAVRSHIVPAMPSAIFGHARWSALRLTAKAARKPIIKGMWFAQQGERHPRERSCQSAEGTNLCFLLRRQIEGP